MSEEPNKVAIEFNTGVPQDVLRELDLSAVVWERGTPTPRGQVEVAYVDDYVLLRVAGPDGPKEPPLVMTRNNWEELQARSKAGEFDAG